jgi:membrane protease YdiL (CAAX protease family)
VKNLALDTRINWQMQTKTSPHLSRSGSAFLELGLLFLPAIPAYLWLWPNVSGTQQLIAQSLTYVYVIVGSLVIGLRRWRPALLGFNTQGLRISLAAGLAILIGRTMIILSVDWGAPSPDFSAIRLLGEALYYFLLVGLGEELLFRGLLFRALQEWRGVGWAIWGSSMCFVLWHLFGQGPLAGAAMLLYGLIFALIRWRAGSILGLIFIHGLIDFSALLLLPDLNVTSLGRPDVASPLGLFIGLALIAFTPLYLWKIHPHNNSYLQ